MLDPTVKPEPPLDRILKGEKLSDILKEDGKPVVSADFYFGIYVGVQIGIATALVVSMLLM